MINYSTEVLRIDDLSVCYANRKDWIINGLNLRIGNGEKIALIGSSGCGKSTIAKAILQLLPPKSISKGQVLLCGQSLMEKDEVALGKIRGELIGLVFQDPMTRMNPLMTVGNHLIDTLNAHRREKSYEWQVRRSYELLARVGIQTDRFNSYPHEFSGGMRQRLAIALALALDPPLIIADEPTTSLDVSIANQVMGELSGLCDDFGTALLLITHDLALASKWCHRISILEEGKIVEESSTLKILKEPQSITGKKLVLAANKREGESKGRRTLPTSKIVLEVTNLRCWHALPDWPWRSNWLKSVDQINFQLFEGETLGIVGASGCGKSTLCRALIGLLPIRGGEVRFNGRNLLDLPGPLLRKELQSLQMVFQDPLACLNPNMTIGQAISDPLLIHGLCNKSQAKEKTRELLSQVGLNPPEIFQNRYPKELSGGQLQRVAIARALSLNPKVLICDESISMLDVEIQVEILALLRSLQQQLGLAILFITHDLLIANGFCNRLLVMDQGRIIEEGSSEEIFNTPQSSITKKLILACPKLFSVS